MNLGDYAEFFKKIYILQDLDIEEIQELLAAARPRPFAAGATIITEGEPGASMFILCEGQVEIRKNLVPPGAGQPAQPPAMRLRAEESVVLGEMALLEDAARSATVTALTPCHVLELSKNAFFKLIQGRPILGVKMLLRLGQQLSRRLRRLTDDVAHRAVAAAPSPAAPRA